MFETFGNKKGIMDLVTKNWDKNPQVQRDEIPSTFRPTGERIKEITGDGAKLLENASEQDLSDFYTHQVQRDESLDEQVNRLVNESYENMSVEHYQPPIDDDAEEYIPKSEG